MHAHALSFSQVQKFRATAEIFAGALPYRDIDAEQPSRRSIVTMKSDVMMENEKEKMTDERRGN